MSALMYEDQKVYQIELKCSARVDTPLGYPWLGFKGLRDVRGNLYSCALIVPGDARAISIPCYNKKIRVAKAYVLAIFDSCSYQDRTTVEHIPDAGRDGAFKYRVGEVVRPRHGFSPLYFGQCASGIHLYSSVRDLQYDRGWTASLERWGEKLGLEGLW